MGENKSKQEKFSRAVTEMFIDLRIPLYNASKDSFRRPFLIADPELKLPSTYMLKKDIDCLMVENRSELKTVLSKVSYVSTTADLWSSYRRSFVGQTIHWLDPGTLKRKSDVLSCMRIFGHHTSEAIAAVLLTGVDSVDAGPKLVTTTVDGAKNIQKSIR